jgi:anti-sigma factor RsiW
MDSPCPIDGETLSRFLDGELPFSQYRNLRDHVPSCLRCAQRLSRFRRVNGEASSFLVAPVPAPQPARLVASLSVAAALVASVATNLLLVPRAPVGPRLALSLSVAPSQNLSSFYETVSPSQAGR